MTQVRPTIATIILALSCVLCASEVSAQYWGERAQGKGFEQTDFYFTPGSLIPFGLGPFAGTTPGVLRDPLLDLVLNPAHLRLDSTQNDLMIYTDFRAARNAKSRSNDYGIVTYRTLMYDAASSIYLPYPRSYIESRRELEPVFSGAVIGRPFREFAPELLLGATYQLMLQDEKYYNVPSDIYRTVMGADYTGRTVAAADGGMPIVDRYSGEDNMHQNGHFISLFAKYRLDEHLEAGVKVGRVLHERNGAYGSSNFWNSEYSSQSRSLWANMEMRDQGYQHWEMTGGILLHLSERSTLGLSGGHLWGTGTQAMTNNDTSFYGYGNTPYQSLYTRSATKLSDWRNEGKSTQIGLEFRSQLGDHASMTLFYRPRWSTVNLTTASLVNDTSDSYYEWTNNTETIVSRSRSRFMDARTGNGEDKTTTDLFLATFTWDLNSRITLSLGAQLELHSREIKTHEEVEVRGLSAYTNTSTSNPYASLYENSESKYLHWTFTAKRKSFRVPVFVTIKASEVAGILLGLSRDMSRWEISDVTLAAFKRRYASDNGAVTEKFNFGERYTMPREETSDIRTTFMAGVTLTPSPVFQARLLMIPVFADKFDGPELEQLQWWLGLTVTP